MKHKKNIEKYNGTLKELAEDIGNLHYESLCEFIKALSDKLESDANKDSAAGRKKLSQELLLASIEMDNVSKHICNAWEISKPYMQENPLIKIFEWQKQSYDNLIKTNVNLFTLFFGKKNK